MKARLLALSLILFGAAALTGRAPAGSATYNFNTDPTDFITTYGNAVWRPTGGVSGTGYLSITDALNSQSGRIVFDDLDSGGIVNSFTFSCELRTGGGTNDPADGYSVSFAREGDPAITGGGFPNAPEEGTQTGLAIILDEYDNGGGDVIGISVRVDGVQVNQTSLPTKNGSASDITSLQTGPAGRPTDPVTFNVNDHTFVPLTVKLDPDGTVDVTYKGATILNNFATSYFPSAGRLIFAGRTGDANSNHHVDNIVINTVASTLPVISGATLSPLALNAQVTDSATVALDPLKPITVRIDGNLVVTTVSKTGLVTSFSYSAAPPNFFAQGAHTLAITAFDTNNNPLNLNGNLTVAPYATMDSAWKALPGQVDTVTPANQRTFLSRIHQLNFARTPGDTNLLPLPERQIQKDYFDPVANAFFPNVANPDGFDNPATFEKVISGVLNWDQDSAAQGNFNGGNGFPEAPIPGIPGTTGNNDNIAGEIYTWMDLPAGVTRLGVNSDDGFTLSVGSSPLDFFRKQTAGVFNGGRGASDTQFDIAVPSAGLYPVRLLWWEGGGGANLEFFSVKPDGTRVLINDTVDAAAIKTYYAGLPAQPSIHAITPYPGPLARNNKHPINIELVDGVAAVNDGSIVLLVDGLAVTPTVTNDGLSTKIAYLPTANGGRWTFGTHNVSLSYNTTPPTGLRTETWTFSSEGQNYAWQGLGTDPNNITDSTNWLNGIAPPNDGTNINLPAGDIISFAANNLTIPDNGGRQINLAPGAQIFSNKGGGGDCRVNAMVNAQGVGPDNNGFFYVEGGGWGMPNNLTLVANGTTTANGNRVRMNDGPNRLDLGGFTMTSKGNNENNFVGTNIVGAPGSRMLLQNFTAFEGGTRLDPNVTVEMAAGVTLTSWGGQGARRDGNYVLNNNSVIETRFDDDDLTFSGPITVANGNTGVLRANIHSAGEPAERNGQDLRLNILGPLTGAGKFRKEAAGTLILSGNSTNTGGLDISGGGSTVIASNTAVGTGPINVATGGATLSFTNGGGQEYIDSSDRAAALDEASKTVLDPAVSGVNSRQALGGNRRTSYTGKFSNPSSGPVLYTFAEQYDDDSYLEIDGNVVLNNTQWQNVSTAQVTLSPGEHDFRVSLRDGGGGSGPHNGDANAFPGWDQLGVGYSTVLPDDGAGGVNADKAVANYAKLGGKFEVFQPVNRSIANNVVLNTDLTISTEAMNGYDATISGNLSGGGALTVAGSTDYATDDLVLAGTGTNSGAITVTTGSLLISGNYTAATGAITVEPTGTLGGTGTTGAPVTVLGSIAPGVNGIGTLNVVNSVVWEGSQGAWKYQVGPTNTSDLLNITGDFVKGGGTTFAFNFQNTGGTGSYKLVKWTGNTAFTVANFSATGLYPGNTAVFQIVGKELFVNLTGPAPGTGGYPAWAATAFAPGTPAGDRDPTDDPDLDGLNNLMEYALNSNPSTSNAGPAPEVVTVGPNKFLQLKWTRPNDRTDITTTGQVSTNLNPSADWVSGPAQVTTTITSLGGGLEEVVIRAVSPVGTTARQYLRARVTQP